MKKVQGNKVLIKPESDLTEKRTHGGLIIPKKVNVESKGEKGFVVAIGNAPGFTFEVEVGDEVLFLPSRREVDEEGYLVIPHEEIVYVL